MEKNSGGSDKVPVVSKLMTDTWSACGKWERRGGGPFQLQRWSSLPSDSVTAYGGIRGDSVHHCHLQIQVFHQIKKRVCLFREAPIKNGKSVSNSDYSLIDKINMAITQIGVAPKIHVITRAIE